MPHIGRAQRLRCGRGTGPPYGECDRHVNQQRADSWGGCWSAQRTIGDQAGLVRAGVLFAFLVVAGCGANSPAQDNRERQQPSVTQPGVHISGDARFGVVKRF